MRIFFVHIANVMYTMGRPMQLRIAKPDILRLSLIVPTRFLS